MSKIFFIDNQDSFTYNLVEELKALRFDVEVYRNTVEPSYVLAAIEKSKEQGQSPLLFLSPGPGKPSESECMMSLLDACTGKYPIVGVCLGHQAIAEYYGGKVVLAGETVHGKSSTIQLSQHPIFAGLGNSMSVARYHSLKVAELPETLAVEAYLDDMPMVIMDEKNSIAGFQFHPESILTTDGTRLLKQTIDFLIRRKEA